MSLIASFSGGLTSAYMTIRLKRLYPDLKVLFMNTGKEAEETLVFVNEVDKRYDLGVVWLEAIVHHNKRKSCTHKIVDFNSAHRGLDIFKEVVKKYGIMGPTYLHCTRELKLNPFNSWKRENSPDSVTAIGIRHDELDRVNENYIENKLIYPLLDWKIKKQDVIDFWEGKPWRLNLPEHRGNCIGCWKKSDRKLYTIAKETPHEIKQLKELEDMDPSRKMFRRRRSSDDILLEAQTTHLESFIDPNFTEGCKESCEPF